MGLPEGGIPEDKLPQCWTDDVRMNALFAPFRLKTSNPESWEMKMKFWPDMLRIWCKSKNDPVVSASDSKVAFQRKGRTPACIDIVIEELFRNGEISPISKYQQILQNGPEGWVRWGARLAFKPAAFALTAVSSLLPGRQAIDNDGLPKACIDSTQRFVLESAIKDQATTLLLTYPPEMERIGTVEELMRNCSWQGSRETFQLLLGYLVSQGAAVNRENVVKLAESDGKAAPITEQDEALVKLTSAERRLEADTTRLTREVAAAESDARAALQLGNKLAAKNHLRRKHKAAQRLERCSGALDNVRQLLHQMKDVHVNVAIVNTYRTTADAMKRNIKDNNMDEDSVHDTMDDLKELMNTYDEVEKALGGTEDLDAAELEEELKELLASPGPPSGGTPGKQERVPTMPSPPAAQPRKISEREFVFDGEERVLAELNELGLEDASPRGKVPLRERCANDDAVEPAPAKAKPVKAWYPPSSECLADQVWGGEENGYGELRQDDRLHPGQALDVDFSIPARLYSTEFQVRDHKMTDSGVWLYNTTHPDLQHSTDYSSSESPGKSGGNFQMAPGGERRKSSTPQVGQPWPQEQESTVESLERRLRNLRGYNL